MNNQIIVNEPIVLATKTKLLFREISIRNNIMPGSRRELGKEVLIKFDVLGDDDKFISQKSILIQGVEHNEFVSPFLSTVIPAVIQKAQEKLGVDPSKITIPSPEELATLVLNVIPEPEPTPEPTPTPEPNPDNSQPENNDVVQ